ncbi:hypothetical protein Hte_000592 [Hypoxylon texense]
MSPLELSRETCVVALQIGSEEVFYIREDLARYHSISIDQYIKDEKSDGWKESNAIEVYLRWHNSCDHYSTIPNYRESMILFIDYVFHDGLENNDTNFWLRYDDMPSTSQMIDAWILGSVLRARGFQDSIFRALVDTGFKASFNDLSNIWLAIPSNKKAGLPALIMDKFVGDLTNTDPISYLKYGMGHYGKEPFMAEIFVSLVEKLRATQTWIHQVKKKGGSSSALDMKKLEQIIEPEIDACAYLYVNKEGTK